MLSTNKIAERKNLEQGFTLVEILIYMAIIGAVLGGFISFSLTLTTANSKNFIAQETQVNNRIALNYITRKVRQADKVLTPVSGASSTSLILDMPGTEENIYFSLNSGIIYYTQGAVGPVAITGNRTYISHLIFSNRGTLNDKDSIYIEITGGHNLSRDKAFEYSQSLHTAVSVRR